LVAAYLRAHRYFHNLGAKRTGFRLPKNFRARGCASLPDRQKGL